MIHIDVVDDATMWCRRPATAKEKSSRIAALERIRCPRKRKRMKGKIKGTNMAVPVMNMTQYVYRYRNPNWTAAEVHSPAIALPKTNWSTLLVRKQKWSLCQGGKVGRHLKSSVTDGRLQQNLDVTEVLFKVTSTDAAVTNNCITRSEQDDMVVARVLRGFRGQLDLLCQGHQVCLLMRPVYNNSLDLDTCCIRLSHILQANTQKTKFLDCLDALVGKITSITSYRGCRPNMRSGTAMRNGSLIGRCRRWT